MFCEKAYSAEYQEKFRKPEKRAFEQYRRNVAGYGGWCRCRVHLHIDTERKLGGFHKEADSQQCKKHGDFSCVQLGEAVFHFCKIGSSEPMNG